MTKRIRVYWGREVPCENPEYFACDNIDEALTTLQEQADKDLKDPSVTDNFGGIEVYEDLEWSEYYDEDGNDAWEILRARNE